MFFFENLMLKFFRLLFVLCMRDVTLRTLARRTFDEALREKWSVAMSSSLLFLRAGGNKRRVVPTSHGVPIVCVTFLPGKGNAITLDSAGYLATHRYPTAASCMVVGDERRPCFFPCTRVCVGASVLL